ncbi:MAG: conjugal transfer protein TraO [Burkholderiaceae bacterium]|nr:conjugal transfer protein TraO [Burkholderiaceae bacterium]
MSIFQADVGRQFKIVVAACASAVLGLGYLAYSYVHSSGQHTTEISPIQAGNGTNAEESEHYSDVLHRYNTVNATSAIDTGSTYLSAMSSRAQQVPPGPERTKPEPQAPVQPPPSPAPSAAAPSAAAAPTLDSRQSERIGEQVLAFIGEWTPATHSTARQSDMPQPAVTARAPSDAGIESRPQQKLVPAFALVPAQLGTDLDTDENSWVFARVPIGEYEGAVLHAPGYRRDNNAVDITFTYMVWNGHTYRVNAKAVDKNSMRTSLAGQVNNRYNSRILLPGIASGLSKAGQLFEQADTQTTTTPFGGVIESRNGPPSSRTIKGTIIGGMATEAAQVLRGDAAQLPPKQVLVARGETIGIRFLESVHLADDVDLKSNTQGAIPANTEVGTASTPRSPAKNDTSNGPPAGRN